MPQLEVSEEQRLKYLEAARQQYAEGSSDSIKVDDSARVSRGDDADGTWVQAWVWVPDEDAEDGNGE